MNRGVFQSSPVQQMMAAGNPNWWAIAATWPPSDHQTNPPSLPTHHHNNTNFFPHLPFSSPSSNWPHNCSSISDNQDHQITPDSWSQQLFMNGIVGEEAAAMEQLVKQQNFNPFVYKNNELFQEAAKSNNNNNNFLWSPHHNTTTTAAAAAAATAAAATSPQSCVTTATKSDHQLKSECNSHAVNNGAAVKKAKVQNSAPESTFKVRKFGDRITTLHQLVSPFGKIVGRNRLRTDFFSSTLKPWLMSNLKSKPGWAALFGNLCWFIWKNRNAKVFGGKTMNQDTIIKLANMTASCYFAAIDSRRSLFNPPGTIKTCPMWCPPHPGWLKLNVDGASRGNPGLAGGGGVVRLANGACFLSFSAFFGNCTALRAELMAILTGLRLLHSRGAPYIQLETDSQEAYDLLMTDLPTSHADFYIIKNCKDLMMHNNWSIRLSKILRGANRVADTLAKLAFGHLSSLVLYESPPESIRALLESDSFDSVSQH